MTLFSKKKQQLCVSGFNYSFLNTWCVDDMEIVGYLNTNELRDLPTQFHLELDVTSEMASGSNLNHKHHRKVSFPLMLSGMIYMPSLMESMLSLMKHSLLEIQNLG